jgi:hypothetical protein
MKIVIILLASFIASLLLFSPCQAQEGIVWSGFGFWVYGHPDSGATSLKLKHVWLIADKQLGDSLEARAILGFQGPPKVVHTLYVKWRHPLPLIDYLRVGKFEPPFGHSINFYRIDRNPTINYSSIDAPVVARAHGIELTGVWMDCRLKLAAMTGERLLGNIGSEYESRWDTYLRLQIPADRRLAIGASIRSGPVPAQGLDLQAGYGAISIEAETVRSRDTTNLSLLTMAEVTPWLTALMRYEYVTSLGNIWTPGIRIFLPYDCEVKINLVRHEAKTEIFLAQLVVRW